MKFLITLVALVVTNCLLAQDPYPRYAIDLNALGENIKTIKQNYSFYSCSVNGLKFDRDCLTEERETGTFKVDSGRGSEFLYLTLYFTNCNINDISILKIVRQEKIMTIYLYIARELLEGEIIYLKNFEFNPQIYFIKLISSDMLSNELSGGKDEPGDKGVIVDFSKQKKVSEKELKKLVAKHTK